VPISPAPGIPISDEPPPIRYSRILCWCGRVFGGLFRPLRLRALRRAEARNHTLLQEVARCENREQLEALIGPPTYVLSGLGASRRTAEGSVFIPDRVERYHHCHCCVDVWYRGDTVDSITRPGTLRAALRQPTRRVPTLPANQSLQLSGRSSRGGA
jgi:hypothetical protein